MSKAKKYAVKSRLEYNGVRYEPKDLQGKRGYILGDFKPCPDVVEIDDPAVAKQLIECDVIAELEKPAEKQAEKPAEKADDTKAADKQ